MAILNLNKKEVDHLLFLFDFIKEETGALLKNQTKLKNKIERLKRPPIKTSSRKAKGRNLQKWVCERIAEICGMYYDQQDDQCDIHSREMGQSGVDIILRGDARRRFPFSIECKNVEKLSLNSAIEQAKKNKEKEMDWLLVYKNKQLKVPVAIMDWFLFEHIMGWNIHLRGLKKEKP